MSVALDLAQHNPASQQDGSYPRPHLVRDKAVLLDRQVGFAHDDADTGLAEGWFRPEAAERFTRQIQLPFAPETELSGINDKDFHPCVWYRIELSADDVAATGFAEGRRLLLHLGAVDHHATVWVDGQQVGTHEGGQVSFAVDLTDALDPDAESHVVVVRAQEDPLDIRQPRGKQDWQPQPHAIWYHRTTGIWRTVWLESVPALHVTRLAWRSDLARHQVTALVELNRRPAESVTVELALSVGGEELAVVSARMSEQTAEFPVHLPRTTNGVDETLWWTPDNPTLIDAGLVVADDQIRSYLGYREVDVRGVGMRLNTRPFYVRSVLQQGYWPQSHLTPPSVEALRDEAQLILDLGLNSARIHQKVEDPRFMFFADKLGLTLWGETASAYAFDSSAVARLTHEWTEIVRAYESHPSIIAWVPFNESWGISDIAASPAQQAYSRALTDLTRALDPTRPVISNDGWEHTNSDLLTIHDYEWRREVLAERYTEAGLSLMLDKSSGPAGRVLLVDGPWIDPAVADAPVIVSEFGGVEYITARSAEETWGYSSASSQDDYEQRVRAIVEPIRAALAVRGFCWTQLTDTLQEANGLCDENRQPKLPLETYREIFGHQG